MTFFEADDYFSGPTVTGALIAAAEARLGIRLPSEYLALLSERNGGVPERRCVRTPFPTSWAPDHFEVHAILGVSGDWGIDSDSGRGSDDMIVEWGYPKVGVVICHMPSGGHDAVMLDYSVSGAQGEPSVVYVDEDRVARRIADNFAEFVDALVRYL